MNIKLPQNEGAKKRASYWNICIVLAIISFVLFIVGASMDEPGRYNYSNIGYDCDDGQFIYGLENIENDGVRDCDDGSDEVGDSDSFANSCGGFICCCSVIFAISALSTKDINHQVVVIQQPQQYVPVIQQVRTVVQPPAPRYSPPPQIQQSRPALQQKSKQAWAAEARNLELARNWEDAADAYQEAGMFSEAGRIRQEHLEQSQPMVQIGQVGNTVLNDSVMIAESTTKTCASCGNVPDPSWKICPHCSNPL